MTQVDAVIVLSVLVGIPLIVDLICKLFAVKNIGRQNRVEPPQKWPRK